MKKILILTLAISSAFVFSGCETAKFILSNRTDSVMDGRFPATPEEKYGSLEEIHVNSEGYVYYIGYDGKKYKASHIYNQNILGPGIRIPVSDEEWEKSYDLGIYRY